MLTEQQCKFIETALTENVEPRKVAAYLCLHMGLTVAELTALRWQDIDLDARVLTLRSAVSAAGERMALDAPRPLPLPPHVWRYLGRHAGLYVSGDCFMLTGETALPAFYHLQNALTSLCVRYAVADSLSATDLRNAFIRRCIQSGMDLYSLCVYVGIKQPNVIVKRFGEYFRPRLDAVCALEGYAADGGAPAPEPASGEPKRMNLLILGAGSQGPVVKEIAEAIGVFSEIAFLDDDANNRLAIDSCENYRRYLHRFPIAIPSFGDSYLREKWVNRLEEAGFILPTLIDPSATVSASATVAEAVVIEPKVTVSVGASVGRGSILSTGSALETRARTEPFVHIDAAATVGKSAVVPAYTRIASGAVVKA